MKKLLLGLTVMALIFMIGGIAYAGSTAAQTFNVKINEINELTVSGNPGGLTVSTATTVGLHPDEVTDNSTNYSITTNGTSKKITGQITTGGAMPAGITLSCGLIAPTGGFSPGLQSLLASSAINSVTGISTVADNAGNTITYTLAGYVAGGTMTSTSKTITLTLCAQ